MRNIVKIGLTACLMLGLSCFANEDGVKLRIKDTLSEDFIFKGIPIFSKDEANFLNNILTKKIEEIQLSKKVKMFKIEYLGKEYFFYPLAHLDGERINWKWTIKNFSNK